MEQNQLETYLKKKIRQSNHWAQVGRDFNDVARINLYVGQSQAFNTALKYVRRMKKARGG